MPLMTDQILAADDGHEDAVAMQRAGEVAGILDPAARVHLAEILHADFRGLEAAQETIAADLLVGNPGGERLDVQGLQLAGDLAGRAVGNRNRWSPG